MPYVCMFEVLLTIYYFLTFKIIVMRTIIKFIPIFTILLAFSACKKNEETPVLTKPLEENSSIKNGATDDPVNFVYEYYLDGSEVDEGTFALDDPNLQYGGEGVDDGDGDATTGILRIHAFTSTATYYDYGDQIGINFRLYAEIADHLYQYADENGYIAEYNETGDVSQAYWDYQTDYIDQALNGKSGSYNPNAKALVTIVHKNWSGGSSWPLLPPIRPFMPLTYKNKVSAFSPLLIGGVDIIYDKNWFKDRMWTYWGWAYTRIHFAWPLHNLDNKAQSWMNFGI